MKKTITLLLLASLSCLSLFATVDFQLNYVYYTDDNGLTLRIQNNGSEDFIGSFTVALLTVEKSIPYVFSGSIPASGFSYMQLGAQKIGNRILIDSKNEVVESNENNNNSFFDLNDSQVRLMSSNGLIANNYRDTLHVLPGELFHEQFYLSDLSYQKSIIGVNFEGRFYGINEAQDFSFRPVSFWPNTAEENTEYQNGRYSYQVGSLDFPVAKCQWLANTSTNATDNFWLGSFFGVNRKSPVGRTINISIYCSFVTTDLKEKGALVYRDLVTIDRLRGDVNDDGAVTEADLNILINEVVYHNGYSPNTSFKNMYIRKGINYGAGIVLFSQPDFISNCLINIWLHDKNDPIVQGLGIGELMSKTVEKSNVIRIPNSFSVTDNNLTIIAPEANLYNVTALSDNKLFQATGEMGELINIPKGATEIRVETVKVPQITTALKNVISKNKANAYLANNILNIKVSGNEKVNVINLSGQVLISTLVNEQTQIDVSHLPKGIYLVKVGNKTIKVIK